MGGDYAHDATPGVLVTDVFGAARTSALAGYRSSAVALDDGVLVVGTSGSELLRGGGTTPIGTEPLHTVASRGGTTVAVGPHGTLHRLVRGR